MLCAKVRAHKGHVAVQRTGVHAQVLQRLVHAGLGAQRGGSGANVVKGGAPRLRHHGGRMHARRHHRPLKLVRLAPQQRHARVGQRRAGAARVHGLRARSRLGRRRATKRLALRRRHIQPLLRGQPHAGVAAAAARRGPADAAAQRIAGLRA